MDEVKKQQRPNIHVYASVWQRVLALIVDLIVITAPLAVISFLVVGNWRGDWITIGLEAVYWLVIPVLTRGYTIGKWMAGIRIEMRKGNPPGYFSMFLRYGVIPFFYIVSLGALMIVSFGMVILRTDRKSLHDFVAGTVVVKGAVPKYVQKQTRISA